MELFMLVGGWNIWPSSKEWRDGEVRTFGLLGRWVSSRDFRGAFFPTECLDERWDWNPVIEIKDFHLFLVLSLILVSRKTSSWVVTPVASSMCSSPQEVAWDTEDTEETASSSRSSWTSCSWDWSTRISASGVCGLWPRLEWTCLNLWFRATSYLKVGGKLIIPSWNPTKAFWSFISFCNWSNWNAFVYSEKPPRSTSICLDFRIRKNTLLSYEPVCMQTCDVQPKIEIAKSESMIKSIREILVERKCQWLLLANELMKDIHPQPSLWGHPVQGRGQQWARLLSLQGWQVYDEFYSHALWSGISVLNWPRRGFTCLQDEHWEKET